MQPKSENLRELKWSVKKKVVWGYVVLVVCTTWVGFSGYRCQHGQTEGNKKIISIHQDLIQNMEKMSKEVYRMVNSINSFLITKDEVYVEEYNRVKENLSKLIERVKILANSSQREIKPPDKLTLLLSKKIREFPTLNPKKAEEELKSIIQSVDAISLIFAELKILTEKGGLKPKEEEEIKRKIANYLSKLNLHAKKINQTSISIIDYEKKFIERERIGVEWSGRWIILAFIGIIVGGPLILVIGSMFTNMVFVDPLIKMTNVASRIAEGNLEERVDIKSQDELGVLADALNLMTSRLKKIIDYQKEQINKLLPVVNAASTGDLTKTSHIDSEDEFGELSSAFNQMVQNLSKLVSQVEQAVNRVTSAANQILASAEEQASGVTEQASQISEVASSLEELTATAKQISSSAQMVTDSAEKASKFAQDGGRAVNNSIEAMQRINQTVQATAKKIKGLGESSRQIGKVITTISDIAEQINLLALNAAIEAARAGEQGKGFAVVADEIRKLAERSAAATEDIEMLIKGIQSETNSTVMGMEEGTKRVDEGVHLINIAGNSLSEIITSIEQTLELAKEISLSTEQQSRGNEQVAAAMSSLSQVIKQTQLNARKMATSAHDLTELANELKYTTLELRGEKQGE